MKFAVILREAGFLPSHFGELAEKTITLFDRKDRIVKEEPHFAEPLFKKNAAAFMDFYDFTNGLDVKSIDSINVKIDEAWVILFYKTPQVKSFSRSERKPLQPLDYME